MRYTINLQYTTGDTFQTYDTEGELGISWENLDVAKDALQRIKEFERSVQHNESYEVRYGCNNKQPIDLITLKGYSPKYTDVCIMLPLDDGTEHRHSRFWDGYFERLNSAEIVPVDKHKEDDGMRVSF
jgi:hypothetical protein